MVVPSISSLRNIFLSLSKILRFALVEIIRLICRFASLLQGLAPAPGSASQVRFIGSAFR